MKLVTLNTWCGRVRDKYKDFFDVYPHIDIWCFQEVFNNADTYIDPVIDHSDADKKLLGTLQSYLKDFNVEFCQVLSNFYGIASFVNKNIEIIDRGEVLVAKGDWWNLTDTHNRDHHRKLQWMELKINEKKVLIAHVHLTHRPEGKSDNKKRLQQSRIIAEFLNMFDCPKILCGDFNLLPDTESIKIIEDAGMRNLVTEYKIPSTRTELYKKPLQFADYIFVSPEIQVNDFKVLPEVVSDHAPLYIDFEIK
ncbi:MAG: hypothetical protein RLY57_257 [Candidatus Parcubacteria bacterium]